MTDRCGIGFAGALLAYAAIEAGCYGFVPSWLAPLLEWGAAAGVIAAASAAASSVWLRVLRWLVPPLAIALRHATDIDAFGAVGVLAALALSADLALGAGAERRTAAIHTAIALLALRTLLATPVGYHLEEHLALGVSSIASLALPGTLDLGPSYGGARALSCAAVVALGITSLSAGQALVLGLCLAAGAVGASVAVEFAARALPTFGSTLSGWLPGALVASQLPWLCTAIVMAAGAAWLSRARVRTLGRAPAVGSFVALAACGVLAASPPSAPAPTRAIYFFEPGYQNWEVPSPDFESTGSYSAGMLGTLPMFCESLGLRAGLGDDLSLENLARFDTLVLINQKDNLPAGSLEQVEAWLERGGRLIVVGDHTFLIANDPRPPENYLNEPLRKSAIRFPNNSADYLNHAFREATLTYGAGRRLSCVRGNPSGSAIGAGLALEWPARPLVVGRHGFNDLGVEHGGEGFIGDLAWNPGERLGDVVLVAEEQRGAGWLLVVGDTTGITNIGRTFAWPAWSALLTGAYHERAWHYAVIGVALLALACWSALRGGGALACASAGLALAAVVAGATWLGTRTIERRDAFAETAQPIGIVDTATRPDGRDGSWQLKGRLALVINLLRAGYLAHFGDSSDSDVLERASVLLVTAPRVNPGRAWAERVVAWVRRGGHVVIACSNPDAQHIEPLFELIGARPLPNVVGPLNADLGEIAGRAQLIELAEPWKLSFTTDGWHRLVFNRDDVLAATRALGRGRVTLFGDSTFLTNEYLEHEKATNLANLHTLRIVLSGAWWSALEG